MLSYRNIFSGCIVITTMCLLVYLQISFQPIAPINNSDFKALSLFSRKFSGFNWESCIEAIESKDSYKMDFLFHELLTHLEEFIIMEPKVTVNKNCLAPVLSPPEKLNCSNESYGTAFTGELNSNPPKIGIFIQFGFNVDVLEIYLNEVYDVIDYFFIVESTKAHYRKLTKRLIWEEVKNQERFAKFADKIVHFIIDDSENAEPSRSAKNKTIGLENQNIWSMEGTQETLRWKKFLEWNAVQKVFEDSDLLGFGDADEIPSRKRVHMLKHCATKPGSIDVGIWFPYGNINYAFRTDFPVHGHQYTLGDPTFFPLKTAMDYYTKNKIAPTRQRGRSKNFILGGIHMTHYGYLPYQLIHDITCSECGPGLAKDMRVFAERIRGDTIRELELERGAVPHWNIQRIVNLTHIQNEMKEIAILPWFYDCNRDRYPVWERKHDTRLD